MGVRKGDMIRVLNELEPSWSIVVLLLPITVILSSQDAADILLSLSTKGYNTHSGPCALVKQNNVDAPQDKPMDVEMAHNIITMTTLYVGMGYKLREYSAMLKTVLQAFNRKA